MGTPRTQFAAGVGGPGASVFGLLFDHGLNRIRTSGLQIREGSFLKQKRGFNAARLTTTVVFFRS